MYFPLTDHLTFPDTKINDHEVETCLLSAEARRGRKATGFFKVFVIRVGGVNRTRKRAMADLLGFIGLVSPSPDWPSTAP